MTHTTSKLPQVYIAQQTFTLCLAFNLQEREAAEARQSQLSASLEASAAQVQSLQQELQDSRVEAQGLKQDVDAVRQQLEQQQQEAAHTSQQLADVQEQLAATQRELAQSKEMVSNARHRLSLSLACGGLVLSLGNKALALEVRQLLPATDSTVMSLEAIEHPSCPAAEHLFAGHLQ